MPALLMRAGDVSIPAFDLRDEPLGHQELKRPLRRGRPDRTGAPKLKGFDQFIGARRATALPERFRYLAPQLCKLHSASAAEGHPGRRMSSSRWLSTQANYGRLT